MVYNQLQNYTTPPPLRRMDMNYCVKYTILIYISVKISGTHKNQCTVIVSLNIRKLLPWKITCSSGVGVILHRGKNLISSIIMGKTDGLSTMLIGLRNTWLQHVIDIKQIHKHLPLRQSDPKNINVWKSQENGKKGKEFPRNHSFKISLSLIDFYQTPPQ